MDFFDRKMNLVDFATEWLRELCESSNVNVYFGVVLINSSAQGSLAPAAFWPDVADPNKAIMQTVEKCVAARSLQACRYQRSVGKTSQDRCAVALPLLIDEQIQAVLALEIELALDGSLEGFQRTAERHLVLLEAIIRREIGSNAERLTAVLNLVATALHYESFQAASTAVATELAGILECERVSIGFVDKGHAVVKALSHSAVFTEKANLVRDLSASMDEAIDQRAITVFPAIDSNSVLVTHHLSELVRSAGDGAACVVPFADGDAMAGAIVLEMPSGKRFDDEARSLCEYAALLLGPLLEVKRRDDRSLFSKTRHSAQQFLQRLIGPAHTGLKLITGSFVLAIAFLSLVDGEYRVTADATLEGAVQRSIAVPLSGFVSESYARAGDTVRQGEEIFTLDSRDLRLEQLKLTSQRAQYKREHSEALAGKERAKVNILNAQLAQVDAQIALVEEQLSRTRVTAPFDSFIVSGDLSQSLGAPVERGAIVFEVAPLSDYRILLEVDERDVTALMISQTGVLAIAGLPDYVPQIEIMRITPVATTKEGRNVFEVEASLTEDPAAALKPGMQGVGKITVGDRKLIWIWTHKIIEWIRMFVWAWWP